MKKILTLFITLAALLANSSFATPLEINIAVVRNQPPYAFDGNKGLVNDLVDALNKLQNKYLFTVEHITPYRAEQGMNENNLDLIAMTNINWRHQGGDISASKDLLLVKDVFFSLKQFQTQENLFKNIGQSTHSISGVVGFSYHYANFETNQQILNSKYNTKVVVDEPSVIKNVLTGKSKLGISSTTSLNYFSKTNPAEYSKLYIHEKADSQYYRHFIISNLSEIKKQEFDDLIDKMRESGQLERIFNQYGLNPAQ